MMTFSEALVHLKAGQDVRQAGWPRGTFVRAVLTSAMLSPELRRYTAGIRGGVKHTLTDSEIFNQDWITA